MKKLKSYEIRRMWLDFFKSKGHKVESSASLVPEDDKSLLWMNAGVTPLKKYFDGRKTPDNPRICNAQKCIRTNDIENVGKTSRHHTFFEMLGNFSIGNYFRDDAIAWAVELLTSSEWFDIPKDKLYMTFYPDDKDTFNRWVSCGIDPSHLVPCKGNFWEIGEGPCGPDTEIFFDRGSKYGDFTSDAIRDDIENDRYIEIWNIVFSQFNSDGSGNRNEYKLLPSKNIDTGCGLERLTSIFQDADTNFDTDLFMPIINKVSELSNVEYKGQESFKIIADHLRTVTFALSDGALFSNEGRGYVLRRLLRRAVKHGISLGIKKPFLSDLVDTVISIMEDYYPYLMSTKELVKKLIKQEEVKFFNTIDSGLIKMREIMERSNGTISGEDAFLLFDTYGFPLELLKEYASEQNVSVDEEGYKVEMNKQKERARASKANAQSFAKQNKEYMDYKEQVLFTGYDSLEEDATIVKVFEEGFVTDKTPFYAICGGQKGDRGLAIKDSIKYLITDTITMPNKQHLHIVEDSSVFSVGDKIKLVVDKDYRKCLTVNHSCCHLMFKALREVLGNHVSQQGSEISDDNLRFDFNHYEPVTKEQILEVERLTNEYINKESKKVTTIASIEEAQKMGAIAEFGEKYSSEIRIVNLGSTIDVCGGTHVDNTKDIEKFMVLSVQSIGSGIYRMTGLTKASQVDESKFFKGFNDDFSKLYNKVKELQEKSKAQGVELEFNYKTKEYNDFSYTDVLNYRDELSNLQTEVKKFEKEINRLLSEKAESSFDEFKDLVTNKGLVLSLNDYDRSKLRQLIDYLASLKENITICLVDNVDNKLSVLVKTTNSSKNASEILKKALAVADGRGGGKADFAQGGTPDNTKLKEIISVLEEEL